MKKSPQDDLDDDTFDKLKVGIDTVKQMSLSPNCEWIRTELPTPNPAQHEDEVFDQQAGLVDRKWLEGYRARDAEIAKMNADYERYSHRETELEAQIADLREALEFYADKDSWGRESIVGFPGDEDVEYTHDVMDDAGVVARVVLAKYKGKPNDDT